MQQILIDFEVFKALTALRLDERHTYNDVIRDLLGLDSLMEAPDLSDVLLEGGGASAQPRGLFGLIAPEGFWARGMFLPNGSQLKATYKQRQYTATIEAGRWIDAGGQQYSSPSAAAKAVTGSNVNGLRFWHVKRPTDTQWYRLDLLK